MSSGVAVLGRVAPKHPHHEEWTGHDGQLGELIKVGLFLYFYIYLICTQGNKISFRWRWRWGVNVSWLEWAVHYIYFIFRKGLSVDITALAREVLDILSAPANNVLRTPERRKKTKSQFFLNSSNKKAKSVTLHIQGLDGRVSRSPCTFWFILQVDIY